MAPNHKAVAKIVDLNDGKLVGKIRFQKSVYFLEELSLGFGFSFEYYHYGPYSEELSDSLNDAQALNLIEIDWDRTNSGAKFAVFNSTSKLERDDDDQERIKVLKCLNSYSSLVLELGATADFLRKNGYKEDPWAETICRKPTKSSDLFIAKSKTLLRELDNFGL